MRSYKTEGIILKRINYGEADRILTAYTKYYGKVKILAKGVRRIKSRRGPNVELFNQTVLFLAKSKNFDLLSEAEVKNSFPLLKKNLKKVAYAYQVCELVDCLCPEKQEHRRVFDLLTDTFNQLTVTSNGLGAKILADFELELLRELGYWPKDKSPPSDLEIFIEQILEKKLKSQKFLTQIHSVI